MKDSVLDVYDRHGATWAALRGEALPEKAWIDRFCGLIGRGAILDIGCGSGVPIARALVRVGFEVTGVDGSEEMLSMFRRNVPEASAICADHGGVLSTVPFAPSLPSVALVTPPIDVARLRYGPDNSVSRQFDCQPKRPQALPL